MSRVKNGASLETAGLEEEIWQAYCARLEERGMLDFDDLLIRALALDTGGRTCFRHLLVDEFQDINETQYRLVRAWSASGSLFVIGDPDQSIYGFRGRTGSVSSACGRNGRSCGRSGWWRTTAPRRRCWRLPPP